MATSFSVQDSSNVDKILSTIRFPQLPSDSCSTSTAGNLAGTASQESGWVALEQPGNWGRDVYDGAAFDSSVAESLKKKLSDEGGYRLLLIRKPGRLGQIQNDGARRVFISRRVDGVDQLFTFCVKDPAELLNFSFTNPSQIPFAEDLSNTVLTLVCAHAKRDQCCALRGRPIARFLAQVRPDGTVWECSHLGGHRYAPTALLLPSAYAYGRISAENMLAAVTCLEEVGVPLVSNLRGRSSLPPAHQVSEVAVRELLLNEGKEPGAEELTFETLESKDLKSGTSQTRVRWENDETNTIRSWDVTSQLVRTEPVPASCGKEAKPAKSHEIIGIKEVPVG